MAETSPTTRSTYRLVSVVNHHGNVGAGHYTAFLRVGEAPRGAPGGIWVEMNDRHCKEVSSASVCTAAAYILFYVREDMLGARVNAMFPPDRTRPPIDLSTVGDRHRYACAVS